jgi:hypothetical protein
MGGAQRYPSFVATKRDGFRKGSTHPTGWLGQEIWTADAQSPQYPELTIEYPTVTLVMHMDQPLSRPRRWRGAINRAESAIREVVSLKNETQELLDQMQDLRDQMQDLRDRAKDPLSEFESAVVDLICLQGEYDCWTVPENLLDSRLQGKICNVTSINFKGLCEGSRDLEQFDSDHAYRVLWEAQECNLPKGYGRD